MLSALIYVSAKGLVFRACFESVVALALVTDRLVDAGVFARINRLAFVDI